MIIRLTFLAVMDIRLSRLIKPRLTAFYAFLFFLHNDISNFAQYRHLKMVYTRQILQVLYRLQQER